MSGDGWTCDSATSGATPGATPGLEALIEGIEQDAERQRRRVAALRARLASGPPAGPPPAAGGDTEEVRGVQQVRERIAELSFFARTSVCAVQPAATPSPESVAAARPLDARSMRRGLDVRVVYDSGIAVDPAAVEHLRALAVAGAGIRLAPGPLGRLILLDGRVAVVPLDPADTAAGALVLHHPGIVAGMRALFERTWDAAAPLPVAGAPDAPDPQDRQVLELLAGGATDEVAARRIGMSGRHVRRRVAHLMDELGAGSRFAAGVAATRRGWI